MGRARTGAMAATVVVALLLAAGTTNAHKQTLATTVTLEVARGDATAGLFHGDVFSGKAACKANRPVTIVARDSGSVVGTGRTDASGEFTITGTGAVTGTEIVAKVSKKVLKKSGSHLHACGAKRSQPVSFLDEDYGSPDCQKRQGYFSEAPEDVELSCSNGYLVIESDGLPEHQVMVGITGWNHHVPLPQPFHGTNVFQIPLTPVVDPTPGPTRDLNSGGRDYIAVSLTGVPWQNPTRQDGIYSPQSDPYLIGETDNCGGHSGRAEDYHYHAGSQCLEDQLGGLPGTLVAYAFDGYPILGFTDTSGETPDDLDDCNGHEHGDIGYHYHFTPAYPYVIGCFHGVMDFQKQPRTFPVRDADSNMRGTITATTATPDGGSLTYNYSGADRFVEWTRTSDKCWTFTYTNTAPDYNGPPSESGCREQ